MSPDDPKKGLADAIKWVTKQLSVKACAGKDWPPNWVNMITKAKSIGVPEQIYVACSRAPPLAPPSGFCMLRIRDEQYRSPTLSTLCMLAI